MIWNLVLVMLCEVVAMQMVFVCSLVNHFLFSVLASMALCI